VGLVDQHLQSGTSMPDQWEESIPLGKAIGRTGGNNAVQASKRSRVHVAYPG